MLYCAVLGYSDDPYLQTMALLSIIFPLIFIWYYIISKFSMMDIGVVHITHIRLRIVNATD